MNRDATTSKPVPQSCWTGSPLTNRIRKHRRELQKLLARHADPTKQKDQLLQQNNQMQQAQRDAAANRTITGVFSVIVAASAPPAPTSPNQ
jgi:hypothetical protein